MEKFDIEVKQSLGSISTNFKDVAKALKAEMAVYEKMAVTEETLQDAKKDVAFLRKIEKSLEERRKEVKKAFMAPYEEFEDSYKKLKELVDKPIEQIDKQLKDFEEKRMAEKLVKVKEIYQESIGDYEEYLPFDSVFDKKWLNATCKDKDIQFDISEAKTKVISELEIIKGLGSEIQNELLDTYRANGNNLAIAIKRNTDYMNDKAKLQVKMAEEKPKAEAMGTLNDMVDMVQTVKIIVSKSDLQLAKNALDFNDISYRVEGE